MIDARTQERLQGIIRRQSRSLLQYVADSYPWTADGVDDSLGLLRDVIEEDRQATASLGRFLVANHAVPPYLGAYPPDFTDINYVSLDFVLARLVKDERQALAALERERPEIGDLAARALVEQLIDTKRRHLQTLEKLAARPSPTTAS
jgi:hypothetical protein